MKIKRIRDKRLNKWVYQGDETIQGRRHRPRAASRAEVKEILSAIRLEARQDKYNLPHDRPVITIIELVEERARDFDLSIKNHRRRLAVLKQFAAHFTASTSVEQLTTADLRAYVQARLNANPHLKPSSINSELVTIAAALHGAANYFPSLENWKAPRFPYARASERGRERVITTDEAQKILDALRAPRRAREKRDSYLTRGVVADLFQVALLTGARSGELRTLTKDKADWTGGIITIIATKTDTVRRIPISRSVRAILRRRVDASAQRYVFSNVAGTGPVTTTTIYRCLRKAATRSGVTYGQSVEGGFTFHDARHTATTELLHAGTDLATVQAITGHSQKTMVLRYGHATLASRQRAIAALEKFGDRSAAADDLLTGKIVSIRKAKS